MLERQIEKHPHLLVELHIEAGIDRFLREIAGQRVGGVHVPGAAEAVARQLVEQDHQRQRPFGRVGPVVALPARRGHMLLQEAAAELRVE
jgi:hypothetical protein